MVAQCNIILAYNSATNRPTYKLYTDEPIYYFTLLDSVSHCELIPLHLHRFNVFIKPFKKYK